MAFPQLHPWTPVDASHAIPYAGGVAKDGSRVYLDKHMPRFVTVDGKKIDAHEAVALHERTEFPLMHVHGMHYADAHQIATGVENDFVRRKYGVDPQKYQAALKDGIDAARRGTGQQPTNLDAKPYTDSGQAHLLSPIQRALSARR